MQGPEGGWRTTCPVVHLYMYCRFPGAIHTKNTLQMPPQVSQGQGTSTEAGTGAKDTPRCSGPFGSQRWRVCASERGGRPPRTRGVLMEHVRQQGMAGDDSFGETHASPARGNKRSNSGVVRTCASDIKEGKGRNILDLSGGNCHGQTGHAALQCSRGPVGKPVAPRHALLIPIVTTGPGPCFGEERSGEGAVGPAVRPRVSGASPIRRRPRCGGAARGAAPFPA